MVGRGLLVLSVLGWCAVVVPSAARALTAAERCQSVKLKAAARYGACRLNADAKAVKLGGAADFAKCDGRFSAKWATAENAGGGMCPSSGDAASIEQRVTRDTAEIATLLSGGEVVEFALSASGQVASFATGDDGNTQAGAPLRFVDNGDGTISDLNTGLMWEKKDTSGGLHDLANDYTFCSSTGVVPCSGPALVGSIWEWLAAVNAEGGTGFAGYNDWRMPNIRELQTLVDFGRSEPAVDPAFDNACCCGCTVLTCSCTALSEYWSSTTVEFNDEFAWSVFFQWGFTNGSAKATPTNRVRAVRGGL